MATRSKGILRSFQATQDLSTVQFHFVARDASDRGVALCPDGTFAEIVAGVLLNDPNTGQAASVQVSGVASVVCSASITAGDLVSCAIGGAAKTAAAGEYVLGQALESGVLNQVISINLTSGGNAA